MQLPRPFGPYTLLRRIAVGGMAEIYVAKTRGLKGFEKLVAIKLVHPHLSADAHFVRMLIDEAKILVLLTHANIAQVFDLGCIDGTYYIAMEFVEGVDVHGLQKAAARVGQQLPVPVCVHIVAEMLNGLDYAHRKRDGSGKSLHIVHRDISPQNVLISQAGEVKLVDFGIAKTNLRGEGTEVGIIKGKYYYMSPEQAWADPMDRRSDIFSTGIVLYEMLTGRMLYSAQSIPELISKVREAEIEPPEKLRPDVPPALSRVVMRALQREPKDRFQSALDMGEALRDYLYENSPSFNAGRLAQYVVELLEQEQRVQAESPRASADATGGLRALTREEFVRNENSVLFSLRDLATRNEALPSKLRKPSGPMASAAPDNDTSAAQTAGHTPLKRAAPPPTFEDKKTAPLERPPRLPKPPSVHPLDPPADSSPPTEIMRTPLGLPRISGWPLEDRASEPPLDEPTQLWSGHLVQDAHGDETIIDSQVALGFAHTEVAHSTALDHAHYPRIDEAGPTSKYVVPAHGSGSRALSQGPTSWPAPSLTPPSIGAIGSSGTPALVPPPGELGGFAIPPSPPIPDFGPQDRLFRDQARHLPWKQMIVGVVFALLGALAFQLMRSRQPDPTLEIVSVPNGARVQVDGRAQNGVTPLRITGLEAGRSYDLHVELDGYLPWDATYHASPGPVQHIAVLKPVTGELHITSQPTGSDVWLDGVPIGKTPLTVSSLAVGRKVRLRVGQTGYIEARRDVAVDQSNLKPVLNFTLNREPSVSARP